MNDTSFDELFNTLTGSKQKELDENPEDTDDMEFAKALLRLSNNIKHEPTSI